MAARTRREFLAIASAAGIAIRNGGAAAAGSNQSAEKHHVRAIDSARPNGAAGSDAGPRGPFNPEDFGIVGQYSADWLREPPLQRLLDNMAAASAFKGVRFFHALDSGSRANTIDDDTLDGGKVWPEPHAPMDFSITFDALEAITSRGLTPFIGLLFFPRAVSAQAATPPRSMETWKQLVRGFLDELVSDRRFGARAVRDWWFEVWNEPNGAPFWKGSYNPQYFDLYRATSEAVVESGHQIRLGGPAIVYRRDSENSRRDMAEFLAFLRREPSVKCDFISFHAKGVWSSSGEPDFQNPYQAAIETAELARSLDAGRFDGLPIVNNEADMRVGFNIPFEARMDERFAAWLCSLSIACSQLNTRYAEAGFRFLAASDNANQQLVQTAFDGRRSIMTKASGAPADLLKLPVFGFYEILQLLQGRHGTIRSGTEKFFPNSDLFHLIVAADTHICSVFSVYPRDLEQPPGSWSVDYTLLGVPWARINIARFRIDSRLSNAYAAAGRGKRRMPFPAPDEAARIRQNQELAVAVPIERDRPLTDGMLRELIDLDPYAVTAYWITPFISDHPGDPLWLEARAEGSNVILRWRPNEEPFFYSYEVYLIVADSAPELLSPAPLRSAIWVDTAPPAGKRIYGIRAISASGVSSRLVLSPEVVI
jgi:hypothetical protein